MHQVAGVELYWLSEYLTDFLVDLPGRRDKAFKPRLSRMKRDVSLRYAHYQGRI